MEGGTKALVPRTGATAGKGPASRKVAPVFYNPAMAFSRDVGVMVMKALRDLEALPPGTWLDSLAATGLRGLRLAREVGGASVVLNDHDPRAVELLRRNVKLNGFPEANGEPQVQVTRSRMQTLLSAGRYAMVDIDPFGTPAPYLDSALQALVNRGVLALTATDLPLLCGAQPRACRRRYGAQPLRGPACAEMGLRILMGWTARRAACYDMAIEPLLGYQEGHHLRAYLRVRRGAGRADKALALVGQLARGAQGGFSPLEAGDLAGPFRANVGGPLWLGPLADEALLERMVVGAGLARADLASRCLALWQAEYAEPSPVGFYSVDELSRAARRGPPSPLKLVESLSLQGHRATLTHFSTTGVRTDADWDQALEAVAGA